MHEVAVRSRAAATATEINDGKPEAVRNENRRKNVCTTLENFDAIFDGWNAHGVKRPNDPSSATRPTRTPDCNLDAMAGFAAAHG